MEHVFGVPGTALVDVWEAIRREPGLRVVRPTSELTASFMANGYARASGRTGILCTISGPGLTYAVSGIAEALLDSVPIVHVVDAGAGTRPDGSPALGAIRQVEAVAPLVKGVIDARTAGEVAGAARDALALAGAGEPGPVLLQIATAALREPASSSEPRAQPEPSEESAGELGQLGERIAAARRPVLLVGMGAAGTAASVMRLAELLGAPVLSTTSGRGVVSEAHPLCIPADAPGASVKPVNELLERSDLVLALGCRLSHNGSRAYALELPPDRLVRVDTSRGAFEGAYPASVVLGADVGDVVPALVAALDGRSSGSDWTEADLQATRTRLDAELPARLDPPLGGGTAADFFAALRRHLPAGAVVATDSGLHQYLVRAHFRVLAPRTLLVPTDFQSMGFGIAAAIGAGIATGEHAVAITGDGGLDIVGLELLTAVRERVPLTVFVLVDGYLGLIRVSQLARTGRDEGVDLTVPELELFARSLGAGYALLDGSRDADGSLADVLGGDGVTIVEVPMGASPDLRQLARRGRALAMLRALRSATTRSSS